MGKLFAALCLLVACGDAGGKRTDGDDSDDNSDVTDGDTGDAGDADDGIDAGIDAPAIAMGCDGAAIAAECPAMLTVTAAGAGEGTFAMVFQADGMPPRYFYQNTNEGQPGVIYSYNRRFTFTCSTDMDGVRQWSGGYADSCFSTNSIGNYTADYSSTSYETRAERCPTGLYAYTGGSPADADMTTCQDLKAGSLTVE